MVLDVGGEGRGRIEAVAAARRGLSSQAKFRFVICGFDGSAGVVRTKITR